MRNCDWIITQATPNVLTIDIPNQDITSLLPRAVCDHVVRAVCHHNGLLITSDTPLVYRTVIDQDPERIQFLMTSPSAITINGNWLDGKRLGFRIEQYTVKAGEQCQLFQSSQSSGLSVGSVHGLLPASSETLLRTTHLNTGQAELQEPVVESLRASREQRAIMFRDN